jgi:hypothetical protein
MADIGRELVRELVRASAFAVANGSPGCAAGGDSSDALRAMVVEVDAALRNLGVDSASCRQLPFASSEGAVRGGYDDAPAHT